MDPISIVVGAGVAVAGFVAGRISRRKTAAKSAMSSTPICTCEHGLHDHDPSTNECHGLIDGDPLRYDSFNNPRAYKKIRCTCRQYTGPQRLDDFWTPPILPPSE